MGMIGQVLAAVVRAIRQIVWMIVDGVLRPVGRTVDAIAGGVWSGLRQAFRRDPIETHETVDDPGLNRADERTDDAVEKTRIADLSPGERVRLACELRRDGRDYRHLFDRDVPAQLDLERWVRRLDERNLARVMLIHPSALGRHLDPASTHRLDLPAPEAVRMHAALVAADRKREAEREEAASHDHEAARQRYVDSRRRTRGRRGEATVPAMRLRA